MFVLDTNVLSEIWKGPTRADPNVCRWADAMETSRLYLSVITVMEIEMGLLASRHRGDAPTAARLERRLDETLAAFDGRILPVDLFVARACARLHVPDRKGERDALIAATALVHRATVVTRNVSDFERTGVPLINPWQ